MKYLLILALVLTLVVMGTGLSSGRNFVSLRPPTEVVNSGPIYKSMGNLTPPPPVKLMSKDELARVIGPRDIEQIDGDYFQILGPEGQPLFVQTTLDPVLQIQAQKWVQDSGALKTALVVLEPATGRILALAGSGDQESNDALESDFPAASIFKIVTAAAAVEKAEYNATTTVSYDGSKHTLFKDNLYKGLDQGVHQSTLRDSFAESINSVFGKLGAFSLRPDELAEMAVNFGFNEQLAFELPLKTSPFILGDEPDDSFRLAELASGFNRDTRISPIHGALIASVPLNGGEIYEPTVISQVSDLDNKIVYRGRPRLLGQAVSLQTAEELSDLMQAAVTDGTGRRQFSDADRHPVLSKLTLGGKSGTINDENGAKVDWFIAFASPISENEGLMGQLALAAVVVHDGRTKVVSQELVRKALLAYYQPKFNSFGRNKILTSQKGKSAKHHS